MVAVLMEAITATHVYPNYVTLHTSLLRISVVAIDEKSLVFLGPPPIF